MDKRVERKSHSLGERYAAMTHDLQWETTYQSMDRVFPFDRYEGIKVRDWSKWEDPFRLTTDAYWKFQGEKEKKLYAVIEAFAQNSCQFGVSDARYVNAIKLILQAIAPIKYSLHRSLAHTGRHLRGDALRVAVQMQASDNLRHFQNETHAASVFNKYFNGLHSAPALFDAAWYLAPFKSFADDVASAGPFERVVAISFSFESLLTDTLFVPYMSGAAHNGDLSIVAAGFSGQSDAARHKMLGIETVKFLLTQDPGNLALVQRWIDKWFWRSFRLMPIVAMMQDYMLSKRMMSWKESWQRFVEAPVEALFAELAQFGLRLPTGWAQACDSKEHLSHQAWNVFYGYGDAIAVHTWIPETDELNWLDQKYPDSFDRWYRPRLAHYAQRQAQGHRFFNRSLPMQCQVCQQPMFFTEKGNPRLIAYRQTEHEGETFHFCSDHCDTIFSNEPAKYQQARLSSHTLLHATDGGAKADLLKASLAASHLSNGRDQGDFSGSEDDTNFSDWGGGQDMKEAQL
jgi:phenol hydroxylase P3 protein